MLTRVDLKVLKATSKLQMGDHIIFDSEQEYFERIKKELALQIKNKDYRVSTSIRKMMCSGLINSDYHITDDGKTAIDIFLQDACANFAQTYLPIIISIVALIISIIALN